MLGSVVVFRTSDALSATMMSLPAPPSMALLPGPPIRMEFPPVLLQTFPAELPGTMPLAPTIPPGPGTPSQMVSLSPRLSLSLWTLTMPAVV